MGGGVARSRNSRAFPIVILLMSSPAFATPADCLASTATEWGSSRYGEWFRCNMGHHLRYRLNVRRAPHVDEVEAVATGELPDGKPEGLHFEVGSLVHGGINWVSDGVMAGIEREWEDVTTAAPDYRDAERPRGFDLGSIYEAQRLLGAYFAHYGEANAGWHEDLKIIAVELQLAEHQAFALPYTSAADVILQHPSGEIIIGDHKTRAKSFPKDSGGRARYTRGLAVRPQFAGLSWLVRRHYGLDYCPAVLVNGIIKTKIPQFDRLRVDLLPEDLAWWEAAQRSAAATGLVSCAPNPTACAPEMGSRCWAFDWCHGPQELKDRKFVMAK